MRRTDVANRKDCVDRKLISSATKFRNPKRNRIFETGSRAGWFPYYAGFSAGFVEDVVSNLNLSRDATVLDPWLGAGTTAEVVIAKRLTMKGYDINPAMLLVARARTIPSKVANRIPVLEQQIAKIYECNVTNHRRKLYEQIIDPLEQWLQPGSAAAFRILERTVKTCILDREQYWFSPVWQLAGRVSPLLSIFYLALFKTLRHFISKFQSSNPTWVKVSNNGERIQVSPRRIINRFRYEIASLHESMTREAEMISSANNTSCVIDQASSLQLPLLSNSIDAVISSPPYCTRIDYVRATLPELAVIFYPNGEITRRLREGMIGTPTINKTINLNGGDWGPTCSNFLKLVEVHSSKASSTYYLKYYRQYFAAVFSSLIEIDRVLKKSGKCVLVVQDSYYKDIKNDLPRIFIEMASHLGWTLKVESPFRVKQTLAGVNPNVKPYRTTFQAIEASLVFSK